MKTHPLAPLRLLDMLAQIESGKATTAQVLVAGNDAIAARETDLQVFAHRKEMLEPGTGPLAGITVGVKDIFDTFDRPTAHGSPIYADHQPASDAAIVSALRAAGATIAGKTVTTEFAWFTPGPTRNPHAPDHTPGGSSSGSAAGVAAGFFPAAIGSQTGGSVIRPAAFCGVAGYKPSFRLASTVGMKHFSPSLDTPGFFAARAADVAAFAALTLQRDLAVNQRDTTPPRIGVLESAIDGEASDDMSEALAHAISRAKAWGAPVRTVAEPPPIRAAHDAHAPIQGYEARQALAFERRERRDDLSPALRDYLDGCDAIDADAYDDARRTANRARKAGHSLFENCDVLLVPSATGAAPHGLGFTGDSVFNRLWTMLGLPCVNVPGLADSGGLPLGLQIIAPFGGDREALQAAHWLETRLAR